MAITNIRLIRLLLLVCYILLWLSITFSSFLEISLCPQSAEK